MSLELVIDVSETEVQLALLKDKKLIELQSEQETTGFSVGDVYLGKVRKIVPSLNAAFVNVGYEKDAFLHYYDLGPQFNTAVDFTKGKLSNSSNMSFDNLQLSPDIDKDGKITDVLSKGQEIVVQVAKEPISSKGPRLSSEVTLAGRYLVLVPFTNKVSISQKIKDQEERDRLRKLMKRIKPKNFGVIIRTVAKNKEVKDLHNDLDSLIAKWNSIYDGIHLAKSPKKLLGELNRSTTVLRDLLNANFTDIHVNDEKLHDVLAEYLQQIAPERTKILQMYYGRVDIFEQFGVNKQIKAVFGKHVSLPSGGYLIVEHTEAMHVVDVNSGNRKSGENNQEENALQTNLEAAEELVRLLRLRDMGGIIAVDFIDMHERENNKKLHERLKELMKDDRAKHNVLAPSKFGVVEITRQRVRPEIEIKTAEKCPVCHGTGEVEATVLLADEIESNLKFLIEESKSQKITLLVHPYLEAYFKLGLFSKRFKWFTKYKKWIRIEGNHSFNFLQYEFKNSSRENIEQ